MSRLSTLEPLGALGIRTVEPRVPGLKQQPSPDLTQF